MKILTVKGNLEEKSWEQQLLQVATRIVAESGMETTILDLKEYPLPPFAPPKDNQKLDGKVQKVQHIFQAHLGFLLIISEENGSFSELLKNFLLWGMDRHYSKEKNNITGRFAMVMSVSEDETGGMQGLMALQSFLYSLGITVVAPHFCVPSAGASHKANGLFSEQEGQNLVNQVRFFTELLSRNLQSPFPFLS